MRKSVHSNEWWVVLMMLQTHCYSPHLLMKFWPLNMIVGCSFLPSAQIVTTAITFSQSALPCLCQVLLSWLLTTHYIPWLEGGQPVSSIAYKSSGQMPNFTTNSSTSANHLFLALGFMACVYWVSSGLLQWVWSMLQCLSRNWWTQFSPTGLALSPMHCLQIRFT